mmetsp:Transcript_4148/g.6249  ORF Transcript_4148/g.6249 Transcript_4148/m.6249 type:complete len:232 (-) Transcript_4148:266-961(-)
MLRGVFIGQFELFQSLCGFATLAQHVARQIMKLRCLGIDLEHFRDKLLALLGILEEKGVDPRQMNVRHKRTEPFRLNRSQQLFESFHSFAAESNPFNHPRPFTWHNRHYKMEKSESAINCTIQMIGKWYLCTSLCTQCFSVLVCFFKVFETSSQMVYSLNVLLVLEFQYAVPQTRFRLCYSRQQNLRTLSQHLLFTSTFWWRLASASQHTFGQRNGKIKSIQCSFQQLFVF